MKAHLTRRRVLASLAIMGTGWYAHADARERDARIGLDHLLRRRRMVRRFRSVPLDDKVVAHLLDTATRAPSAGHTQPWGFVVVRNADTRAKLGRAAHGQMWLADAPVAVVACAERTRSRARYGERGDRYALIDTAFASLLLLLAVVEEGLGACFVGAFDDDQVSRLLRLPKGVQPVAILPVGQAAERPARHKRRPLGEMIHQERW